MTMNLTALLSKGRACWGATSKQSVAGQYSHVQLINPAGSGVTVIVYSMRALVQSSGSWIELCRHYVKLTTDTGHAFNARIGAAAPAATLRTQANAAQLGTKISEFIKADAKWQDVLPAGAVFQLDAGTGILLRNEAGAVNFDLGLAAYWVEL